MDYFADIFLGAGALAAAFYCLVLSKKLSKLSGLDQDLGGAIAVLSKQVDDMTRVLAEAKSAAGQSSDQLDQMSERAENVAARLEMMLAALEDLPEMESGATLPPSSDARTPDHEPHSDGSSEPTSIFLRHAKSAAGAR